MQVSVESTGALERKMTLQVPADRVDNEVASRLRNMAKTVRIDGFRPGKVPIKVVEQKFGKQVRAEVRQQVVQSTLDQALSEQQIQPAGEPVIELNEGSEGAENLEYTVTFEVLPELNPQGFEEIKVEKPVVAIGDADVDKMLAKLQRQRAGWKEADRAAQMGDKLVIDFDGTVDGKAFAGGSGKNVSIELGSGMFIEGFEEQLVGMSAGEERVIKVTFPEQYHSAEVAGKDAEFKVNAHTVVEMDLPELDDTFARDFGVGDGGIEQLRAEVRRNMDRELEQALRLRLKNQVFDGLLEQNRFDAPAAMVRAEQERLVRETSESGAGTVDVERAGDLLGEQAAKRVKLGLLVNEIVKGNGIELDHARVRTTVEGIAASYENPDEVVAWYYQNQEALAGIQAVVIEDQVVDWLLERVSVEEKPMDFYELLDSGAGGNG